MKRRLDNVEKGALWKLIRLAREANTVSKRNWLDGSYDGIYLHLVNKVENVLGESEADTNTRMDRACRELLPDWWS